MWDGIVDGETGDSWFEYRPWYEVEDDPATTREEEKRRWADDYAPGPIESTCQVQKINGPL